MCGEGSKGCQHPDRLKGRDPKECSPEQIRQCHGDIDPREHPCVKPTKSE